MTSDDPAKTAKDIVDRTSGAADRVRSGLNDAATSMSGHASDAAGRVSDVASDAYQRAQDAASSLGERVPSAGDAVEAGRRAYDTGNRHLARQIGRQPIEALLLAGAIGYLVGWAANRN